MAFPVIPRFQTGFRLIDGSALNKMVDALNDLLGNGTAQPVAVTTITASSTATFNGAVAIKSSASVSAGSGTATFALEGPLSINVTPTGSGTATTTQSIISYTLPANSLASAGQTVYVEAWGTYGANADSKNVGLKIGGASAFVGAGTTSGTVWYLAGQTSLKAASSESLMFTGQLGATPMTPTITTDTSDNTAGMTIAVQGVTAGTASDIIVDGLIVTFARVA